MRSTGERVAMRDGRTLHAITLKREDCRWIGDVVLDYNDQQRWGRLHTITDYGNYGCRWMAVPQYGFTAFVADMDADYMMKNLSRGHDEAMVCDMERTAVELKKHIMANFGEDEGAEYLGDALDGLRRLETESELWDWQARHREIAEPEDLYACIAHSPGRLLPGYKSVVVPALQAYLRAARKTAD